MHQKKMTNIYWLKILEAMGLQLSQKSGGYNSTFGTIKRVAKGSDSITLYFEDGNKILFMDGGLFFETIRSTEKLLKIKLFD